MRRVIRPRHRSRPPNVNKSDSLIRSQDMTNRDGSSGSLEPAFTWGTGRRRNSPGKRVCAGMVSGKPGLRGAKAWNWPEELLGGQEVRRRLGIGPAEGEPAAKCHDPPFLHLRPMIRQEFAWNKANLA